MPNSVHSWLMSAIALCAVLLSGFPAPAAPPVSGGPPAPVKSGVRYDHHKLVRVRIESVEQLQAMTSLGAILMNCEPGIGDMDYVVSPSAMNPLAASGMTFSITTDNIQPLIDASVNRMRAQAANPKNLASGGGNGGWFDDFKTYEQVNSYMSTLAALRPDLASVITVGTSIENRTIYGLRLTSLQGPAVKPGMVLNGCQHAREWVAVMVPMYAADYLVRYYDSDPRVQAALDNLEIFIVPIVNVDGYEYTYDINGNRLWRKNRRINGDGSCGVDLNRNWAVNWGGPHMATSDPNSELYYGTAAFSEPEIAVLRDLIVAHPNIRGHIDVHSYGQLILQPWSGQYEPPAADYDVIDSLGAAMNAGIHEVHATPFFNGWGGHLLYLASGVITDWCYGDRGLFTYTIEVRDKGLYGFLLPPEQILPTCEEALGAVLAMTDRLGEGLQFDWPYGTPPVVSADQATPVSFDVHPLTSGPLVTDGARMFVRVGPTGSFEPAVVTALGGDRYQASLPSAARGEVIEYYFEAETQAGVFYRSPVDAPSSAHQARAYDLIYGYDFEVNLGWYGEIAGAINGDWQRGVPVASPTWPYDPPGDADGSGQCYVTSNIDTPWGNGDVDAGAVILYSPVMDLSDLPSTAPPEGSCEMAIAYAYFLHLASVGSDSMVVEISDDGGLSEWVEIARHTETIGQQWRQNVVTQTQLAALNVSLTSTMQLRFTVTDGTPESITEGGVDAVRLITTCDGEPPPPPPPPPCPPDVSPQPGNGIVNIDDLVVVITSWGETGTHPADVTHDQIVNIDDLVAIITAWGACP